MQNIRIFKMTPSETSEEISGKDIIQTDAAIIAGILILLTISSFSPFEFPKINVCLPHYSRNRIILSFCFLHHRKKINYRKEICKGRVYNVVGTTPKFKTLLMFGTIIFVVASATSVVQPAM